MFMYLSHTSGSMELALVSSFSILDIIMLVETIAIFVPKVVLCAWRYI